MWNLITSYIVQSGECVLPGIGTFTLVTTPATLDVVNKEMLPPHTEFRFTDKTGQPTEGLIQYVAFKNELDKIEATAQIKFICGQIKEKIFSGETISFNSIGILHKDESENIVFEQEKEMQALEPVAAIRVVHKEVKHSMIVGDREIDSSEMNEFLNGEPEVQPRSAFWKIAAVVLLLIGTGILVFHFYTTSSSNPLGNGTKVVPAPSSKTYIAQ